MRLAPGADEIEDLVGLGFAERDGGGDGYPAGCHQMFWIAADVQLQIAGLDYVGQVFSEVDAGWRRLCAFHVPLAVLIDAQRGQVDRPAMRDVADGIGHRAARRDALDCSS